MLQWEGADSIRIRSITVLRTLFCSFRAFFLRILLNQPVITQLLKAFFEAFAKSTEFAFFKGFVLEVGEDEERNSQEEAGQKARQKVDSTHGTGKVDVLLQTRVTWKRILETQSDLDQ